MRRELCLIYFFVKGKEHEETTGSGTITGFNRFRRFVRGGESGYDIKRSGDYYRVKYDCAAVGRQGSRQMGQTQ